MDGMGNADEIKSRVNQIRTQIEETSSDFDREKLQERLAKLAGGVAVIKVGAATETELKEKKNIHTLLPMMDHIGDMNLVIAGGGDGEYAEGLRKNAAGHKNIIMTGFVTDAERNWLFANCVGLCFPSLFEGFGRPIIEAMQWGKPVFCSTFSSIPETAGDQAYYFHDFEAESMARVVSDGLKAFTHERSDAAKEYAETFSYERHMNEYLKLYITNH